MTLKINPIVATLLIAGIIILIVALFKGCHQSKLEVAAREKATSYADSIKAAFDDYITNSDSSKKEFQDSLEFERGHNQLIEAQKAATEMQLDKITKENKELIAQHKLAQYTDTTATYVPHGFIVDCEGCFIKLETTTNLANKYKNDVNGIQANWDRQTKLYQKRFKELDEEKLGFNNKIGSLLKAQQEALDKLKPHGRLYLSWGVLFQPWPKYAGAGAMYQNKHNLIIGAMWYYGTGGHMVQTTINFPLSLRFK